jgi:hypothetical protein
MTNPSGIVPVPPEVLMRAFGKYMESGPKISVEFSTTTFSISSSESNGTWMNRFLSVTSMIFSHVFELAD